MEYVVWLSFLGALLALDQAMVGQFMISQPLIAGALIGALLGDLPAGLLVGAMLQLIWIGVLPVGAYIPSDHTISSGIATALTIMLMRQQGGALGACLIFALAVAIPAGWLSGKLDVVVRHFNSRLARQAEPWLNQYGLRSIDAINLSGLITAFIRNFVIYLLWLGPLAILFGLVFGLLPLPVTRGLGLVFWVLPMLPLAILFDMLEKNSIRCLVVAAFALIWVALGLWSGQAVWLLAATMVAGALLAARSRVR